MADRRASRGGARNRQVDLLADMDAIRGEIVAVTGNRGITAADREVIAGTMRRLAADPEVAAILFGGAVGADTEALRAAHAAREGDRPRLVVVLPDTLAAQPAEARRAARLADERIELRRAIGPEDRWRAFHMRNRYMVDRATRVVAFWNGEVRSGTGATVSYARKQDVPVEVVDVEGGD